MSICGNPRSHVYPSLKLRPRRFACLKYRRNFCGHCLFFEEGFTMLWDWQRQIQYRGGEVFIHGGLPCSRAERWARFGYNQNSWDCTYVCSMDVTRVLFKDVCSDLSKNTKQIGSYEKCLVISSLCDNYTSYCPEATFNQIGKLTTCVLKDNASWSALRGRIGGL